MLPGTIIVIYWDHSGAWFPSGVRRGLLSQSSQEAAGAAFPSPEGTTPAQASGHTNSFFFFQQRGIMEWFGISEPIPSPEQGHLPHPALDTCRGLAAPAALGKDTIPAPLSLLLPQFPRWEWLLLLSHSSGFPGKKKNSSSSALCQRLHLISLGKPTIC